MSTRGVGARNVTHMSRCHRNDGRSSVARHSKALQGLQGLQQQHYQWDGQCHLRFVVQTAQRAVHHCI